MEEQLTTTAPLRCLVGSSQILELIIMELGRRSRNYGKTTWDIDHIQHLSTPYGAKEYVEKTEKLRDEVEIVIEGFTDEVSQLELIHNLQRLDISHHFKDSIQKLLGRIHANYKHMENHDLHITALKFRLLRQYGYHVSPEVFSRFMDDLGNFKACLGDDVKGLLSLYEASFLSFEAEPTLDSANHFATHHLTRYLHNSTTEHGLIEQIKHALELPLHWREQKLQARWFINIYVTKSEANPILLEFAKLYHNIAQASYQDDLKRISWGHKKSGLGELSFARDRVAENFLWVVGCKPEPHFGYVREVMTKVIGLVAVIDDTYMTYMEE